MSNATVFASIKKTCNTYKDKLKTYDEDRFELSPPGGGWSYSEVYNHIFDASLLSLIPMKEAIQGNGEKKQTAFIVKVILFFGSFPPAKRFKVPKRLESRIKKITKAEADRWITEFIAQLDTDYALIGNADLAVKTLHPRLGYLNASQWLRVIEIHLKHHLKQLKRIEKSF